MLAQLPTPAPGDLEKFALSAAAVLSIAALVKKILPARRSDSDFVTRGEQSTLPRSFFLDRRRIHRHDPMQDLMPPKVYSQRDDGESS